MASSDDGDIFEEEGVEVPKAPIKSVNKENKDDKQMLSQLKITVSDPEKKTKQSGLKMQETFVVYLIESSPKTEDSTMIEEVSSLWRRYSEFELLRNYLVVTYPTVIVPPLPEKRANFIWTKITATDTFDADFLERRRGGLESFLHRIAGHSKLGCDKLVSDFITKEEGFREKVTATGFQAKSDSWLKKVNASLRVKQPDIRFEQLKCYANQLHEGASALLKVRAKLAERVYGIYKIHGNYARVFKEWALTENSDLKLALQKASNEVEVWANSIDTLIDEEDIIAEQLKEYLYFADSLKTVCKKHEAQQYDVEWYENQVMLTMTEKKKVLTGNTKAFSLSGMKARLLGGDTAEQTEQKLEQLDKNIRDLEDKFESHRSQASDFLEEALQEVEIFKKRKRMDLREIFISYTILQIKLHREGCAKWGKFKSLFDNLLKS
ncbi:sorting nexin-4-like [Clavelina lepadiformis]|uniref:sorting nexin-4-like n=1 Tax=Clavelina lepadiformis TaxID=159417 RepID=UPI004042CEFD